MTASPMTATASAPTRELLAWIAARPRTYAEAIEAWGTHCPRLSVWDDAVIDGLVRIDRSQIKRGRVLLTDRGRALLPDGAKNDA